MIDHAPRLIATAIRYRRRLIIRYAGQAHARVIEPHILYRAPDGLMGLVGYLVKGDQDDTTDARRGTFWRPFQVQKIERIYVAEDTFTPRERQGFATVKSLLRGEVLAQVEARNRDNSFLNVATPARRDGRADRVLSTQGVSPADTLHAS